MGRVRTGQGEQVFPLPARLILKVTCLQKIVFYLPPKNNDLYCRQESLGFSKAVEVSGKCGKNTN